MLVPLFFTLCSVQENVIETWGPDLLQHSHFICSAGNFKEGVAAGCAEGKGRIFRKWFPIRAPDWQFHNLFVSKMLLWFSVFLYFLLSCVTKHSAQVRHCLLQSKKKNWQLASWFQLYKLLNWNVPGKKWRKEEEKWGKEEVGNGKRKGEGREGRKRGREWWTEKTSPSRGSVCLGQKDSRSLISIRLSLLWIRPIQSGTQSRQHCPFQTLWPLDHRGQGGIWWLGCFCLSGNVFTSKQLWFGTQEWRCHEPSSLERRSPREHTTGAPRLDTWRPLSTGQGWENFKVRSKESGVNNKKHQVDLSSKLQEGCLFPENYIILIVCLD